MLGCCPGATRLVGAGAAAGLAFWSPLLDAQLPAARLDAVFPAGVQAGATVEITLHGSDLDGAERLLFSVPGLSAEPVWPGRDAHGVPVQRGVSAFRVRAEPSVGPGFYEVWAVGHFGRSNPKPFAVGSAPERSDGGEPALSLPSTLNGHADDDAVDRFTVTLAAGQRLTLRCYAEALDSRMEPVVEVWDPSGEKIGAAGGDGAWLEVQAAVPGDHEVHVYDLLSDGGTAYPYRLELGQGVSGAAGPARGDSQKLESVLGSGGFGPPPGAAEPAPITVVPAQVSGGFGADGWRRYRAEPRDPGRWAVEVFSDRLGSTADPALVVSRLKGVGEGETVELERVAENDDGIPGSPARGIRWLSRDPALVFDAEAGKRYAIDLRDQFHSGADGGCAGPDFLLQVRLATPDFDLFATVADPLPENQKFAPWPGFIRRGGSVALELAIHRRDGFDGEVTVEATGLPDGVTCPPVVIAAGERSAMMVAHHTGGEAAPPGAWDGAVTLTGTAETGGQQVRQEAVATVPRWAVNDWNQERVTCRTSDALALSLASSEAAPFALSTTASAIEVSIGAKAEIPLHLATPGGFKGSVTATLTGVPGMGQPPSVELSAEKPDAVLVLDATPTNENKLRPGRSTVVVRAEGTVQGYRANPDEVAHWEAEKKRLEGVEGADESRARIDEFLRQANERANPADRKAVAYAGAVPLTIHPAPEPAKEGGSE
jgi:hypothetical protein